MKTKWTSHRFEELLSEPVRNGIYKKKEFHGRGARIVNMGELFGNPRLFDIDMKRVELTDKEKQKSLIQNGDLLFARRSLTAEGAGKCTIVKDVREETTFESSIIRARPDSSKVDSDYLYYFFSSPHGKYLIGSILRQVAVAGITGSDLKELTIPTPEIDQQKAIVHVLSTLDDKIELNRQMNETLEAMAQALFKSWFVDFDPVIDNALAAGNEIPEPLQKRAAARQALDDQRKPLPADIQSLFPDRFVFTDEMGWVPEGWELGSLSDIATLKTKSIHPNKEPDKVWFHYSLPAYDDQEEPSHDLGESIKSGKYFVDQTSILVSKLNPGTPRVWMPCIDDEASSICSTEFMSFVPIVAGLRIYLYALARSDTFQSLMLSRVTGSTGSHQRVQPKGIAESEVLVPPEKLMLVFSAIADTWLSKKDNNKKQTLTLTKSRDSLLPKLLSGELRISDAEKQVAEAE